jgi:DNA-binding beta-propeller fold protein YncE
MLIVEPNRKLALVASLLTLSFCGSAYAVPFDEGDVFAAIGSGLVQHYNSSGALLQTLDTTNGGFTTGMAFDASDNLYVTNFSASRLAVFDTNGNLTNPDFVAGLSTPESVVFDDAGNLYVGNLGNGIRKYTASGVFQGTVVNTRVDFFDLTADQSTFYYGQELNEIKTVSNALPGILGPDFATGLTQAFAMRVLPNDGGTGDASLVGGLLVADNSNIKLFDNTGSLYTTYDLTGVDNWFALNLDPDGTSFWSGSFGDGILRKIDISSAALLQTIDTGCGSGCLYGVAVAGEITAGGPGPEPMPTPGTLWLVTTVLAGFSLRRLRREIGSQTSKRA